MEFKVTIINFVKKTKESKKELIVWAFIVFIITHYVFEPLISYIDETFSPKPEILSNIIIFRNANLTGNTNEINNSIFAYFLGTGWATLYLINASDLANNNSYGTAISPVYFDFRNCTDCSYYSFSLKNNGNKDANRITIDVRSSSTPELIMSSPKITTRNCEGYFGSKGCYMVLENFQRGDETYFVLKTEETSILSIASCQADEKYDCEYRFINILAQSVNPNKDFLTINGIKVIFPTLSNSEPNTMYYFDPNNFDKSKTTWTFYINSTIIDIGK